MNLHKENGGLDLIRNATLVTSRFGYWPSFHDAEILRMELSRTGPSPSITMDIYTFQMLPETDDVGRFRLANRCIVTMVLRGVRELELSGFNEQNVISGLTVSRDNTCIAVVLHPCYGMSGRILCGEVEIATVRPFGMEGEEGSA